MLAVLASFAYADALRPGYKNIGINNHITNINDYPDYVFFTVGEIGPSMCPVQVIGPDGAVPSMYKFCSPSVYAIKKSEFNMEYVSGLDDTGLKEYVSSPGIQKVLTNIKTIMEVPATSTETSRTEYHTITLGQVKEEPTKEEPVKDVVKTVVERSYLFYVYIVAAAVALALIVFFVFKKRKIV